MDRGGLTQAVRNRTFGPSQERTEFARIGVSHNKERALVPVTEATTFEVSHKGAVSAEQAEAAVDKLKAVAEHCREPIHHFELRVSLENNPRLSRPAIAEVTLDVDGQPVRAHEAADAQRCKRARRRRWISECVLYHSQIVLRSSIQPY